MLRNITEEELNIYRDKIIKRIYYIKNFLDKLNINYEEIDNTIHTDKYYISFTSFNKLCKNIKYKNKITSKINNNNSNFTLQIHKMKEPQCIFNNTNTIGFYHRLIYTFNNHTLAINIFHLRYKSEKFITEYKYIYISKTFNTYINFANIFGANTLEEFKKNNFNLNPYVYNNKLSELLSL